MADRIVENADRIVDEMRRKARRRLVGAIVLALAAAIILPMLLEKEPRPLGDDVTVRIPAVDEGKFINKLTGKSAETRALPKADEKPDAKTPPGKSEPRSQTAPSAGAAAASGKAESSAAGKSVAEGGESAMTPPAKSAASSDADTAAASPAVDARPDAKPVTGDAPAAEDKTATASVTAAPSPPVHASPARVDGFVVQLAAFADDKGANSLATKLKKAGYAAFVEPVHTSRGTLWRVRVGGYGSKPEADAARVKLKGEGFSGIVAPAS